MTDTNPGEVAHVVNRKFGAWMRNRRRELAMTQLELADRIGLSRSHVVNIEKGRTNILLHHAVAIERILNAPADEQSADIVSRLSAPSAVYRARRFLKNLGVSHDH